MDGTLHQKDFGRRVFTFKKIPPTKSVRVIVPIGRFLAPALATAARAAGIAPDPKAMQKAAAKLAEGSAAKTAPSEPEMTEEQKKALEDLFSQAIQSFMMNLDEEQLVKVQVVVFGSVLCKGKPIEGEAGINETFETLEDMVDVFWEAMVYNYGPFLRGRLSGFLSAFRVASPQSTPPTSTGGSGPP